MSSPPVPIIIQARMSSSRLPGKMLKSIKGIPLLDCIIRRLSACFDLTHLTVATSQNADDDEIFDFCALKNVTCFRGDLHNVASRYEEIIQSHPQAEYFARVCGDSPLYDPQLLSQAIEIASNSEERWDIVTNVCPRSFPKGQSVEVISKDAFLDGIKSFNPEDQEHVTQYFYRNATSFSLFNIKAPEDFSDINLCIDCPPDQTRAEKIIEKLGENWLHSSWHDNVQAYLSLGFRGES